MALTTRSTSCQLEGDADAVSADACCSSSKGYRACVSGARFTANLSQQIPTMRHARQKVRSLSKLLATRDALYPRHYPEKEKDDPARGPVLAKLQNATAISSDRPPKSNLTASRSRQCDMLVNRSGLYRNCLLRALLIIAVIIRRRRRTIQLLVMCWQVANMPPQSHLTGHLNPRGWHKCITARGDVRSSHEIEMIGMTVH